jgi:hypothetical protein
MAFQKEDIFILLHPTMANYLGFVVLSEVPPYLVTFYDKQGIMGTYSNLDPQRTRSIVKLWCGRWVPGIKKRYFTTEN